LHLWLHHFFRGVNVTDGDHGDNSGSLWLLWKREAEGHNPVGPLENTPSCLQNAGGIAAHCVEVCCVTRCDV